MKNKNKLFLTLIKVYIYDFTKSNIVLCDTRKEEKDKDQLFLKKFPQINYSIKQIERMSDDRLNMFCKFMKNKNIIFILKEESSLDTIEKFIIYFIANNFDGKFTIKNIYILNEYIQKYQDNDLNTYRIEETPKQDERIILPDEEVFEPASEPIVEENTITNEIENISEVSNEISATPVDDALIQKKAKPL